MWRMTIVFWLALGSFPALAHDLWIEKDGSAYVLRYGHRGGAALPIDAAKLEQILCIDAHGQKTDLRSQAVIDQNTVRFQGACNCVSVFYHFGFYSFTPDGEKNVPKNKVKDAVKSWESRDFVKFLDTGTCETAFGDELEIVLGSDIHSVRVGDKITVRVLYRGAPAAAATIAYHDHTLGVTNSQGEARVRLRQGGMQFIRASMKQPLNSPEADSVVLSAGLLFEVGQ